MVGFYTRARLLVLCGLIMLAATACYQNIGDEENPNAVSMGFTETPTPEPTPTETPTPEPTFDLIPEETEAVEEAQSAQDLLMSDTGGPFPTETPTPIVVAQQDNFSLTATVFVLSVTQTQEASLTQTAIALGLGATETPFVTPFPTGSGVFPTNTSQAPIAPPGSVCIHDVQVGDNLFRLSLRYGVSVNQLAAANGITNIQLIFVGQDITIPGCGTTGVYPPPTAQPTGGLGTGGFGTPEFPSQSVGICSQHVVQQGETLFQLSLRYGVSVNSIAAANGISNINVITMTDVLQIPCATGGSGVVGG